MECDQCGAPVRDEGAFCSHCGGRIKRAVDPTPSHLSATAAERFDLVERHSGYRKACEHVPRVPATAESGAMVGLVVMIVFTLVSVGAIGVFAAKFASDEEERAQRVASARFDEEELRRMVKEVSEPRGVYAGRSDSPQPAAKSSPKSSPRPTSTSPARSGDGWGPGMMLFVWVPMCLVGIGVAAAQVARRKAFEAAPVTNMIGVVVDERVEVKGGGKNSSARTHYYATLQSKDGKRREYECESLLAGRIAAPDIGVAFLKGGHLVDFIRFEV